MLKKLNLSYNELTMKSCSVNAIIFSEDEKKVLIILRRDVPVWVIPGGKIDLGETPEDAVTREALEETGCRVSISWKSGLYHPINRLSATTHVFVCKILDGALQTGSETKDIGFFPLDALPKNFFYIHKEMIDLALQNKNVTLEKSLSQITYAALFKYFLKHPVRVIRVLFSRMGLPINT